MLQLKLFRLVFSFRWEGWDVSKSFGRYDRLGEQRLWPFALFLKECGIVLQYTMSGKPSINGVAEQQNQTLKDIETSMVSHYSLPESFWGEALKTVVR